MKKLAAEACLFNVGYMCMKFLSLKLTDALLYLFITLLIDCSIGGNTTNKPSKVHFVVLNIVLRLYVFLPYVI